MAFVYKSEFERFNILNKQNDLGPGEYLDKNPKPESRQNQEPFLSSFNGTVEFKNENPGPGAYYKDFQKIKNLRNLMKSENNQNMNYLKARVKNDIIYIKRNEKFGFDSTTKRFNFNNNFNPGPGYYFPSIINNKDKNINNKPIINKENKKFKYIKIKSPAKIDFTPNFVIEGNKHNNQFRKTFQYDNFGCRPKLFNFRKYREFIESNDSNSFASTNYSDVKNNKKFFDTIFFNIKNSLKNNNDNNNEKNNLIKKIYKNSSYNKNTFKMRNNLCKKNNKRKKKIKNELDDLIENKNPGPGYYFDYIHDTGIHAAKPKSKYYQFFDSKEKRFHSLNKSWTHLGPGEYFIANENKDDNEEDIVHIPFGSNSIRNNSFISPNINPGPGEYEIESFTNGAEIDLILECNKKFGITGERFNENKYIMRDKYKFPGPGYYNPKTSSININNNYIKNFNIFSHLNKHKSKKKKHKLKNSDNQFINGVNLSVEEFKYKEKIPPIGYYYPEYFYTIEYKNKKKVLDSKQDGICFNRTVSQNLKKTYSTSDLLGPGYYNNNKQRKKIFYQIKPPFHSSCERGLIPKNKEKYNINLNDLKQYYMNEYFKWNKKSYNINFM